MTITIDLNCHRIAIIAEKLRRKDLEVSRALEEKQRLIAEILNVPLEEFEAAMVANSEAAARLDLSSSSSATAVATSGGGGGSSSSSSTLHPGAAAALADKDAREVLLAALAQGSPAILYFKMSTNLLLILLYYFETLQLYFHPISYWTSRCTV